MTNDIRSDKQHDPICLLRGTYATSYLGYIYLVPPASSPLGVPQIGAFQPAGAGFTQVSGYRLHTFTGYFDFHGDGSLQGKGFINRGGITPVFVNFTGTYTVIADNSTTPTVYSGKFHTIDAGGVDVEYFWVMSDNWRRLEFSVLHGSQHNLVVAGTLMRV